MQIFAFSLAHIIYYHQQRKMRCLDRLRRWPGGGLSCAGLCPPLRPTLLSHIRNRSCNESPNFSRLRTIFKYFQSTDDIVSIEGKYILYHTYFTVYIGFLTSPMLNLIAPSKIVLRILKYHKYSGKIRLLIAGSVTLVA